MPTPVTSPVYSGLLERDPHVALRGQVVHLVGLAPLDHPHHAQRIAEVAVVQVQLVEMLRLDVVEAAAGHRAGSAHDPVHLVALGEQQLGQIRAVLAGDPRDQSAVGINGLGLAALMPRSSPSAACWARNQS